jgi:acetyl esterase
MGLDSQAQEVLDQYAKYEIPALETLTPEMARNQPLLDYAARDLAASKLAARLLYVASPAPEQVGSVKHQTIAGPGSELLLRIYTPSGDGPFPVLVYFHGGGWVVANLNTYDASARALCNAAECIVVSAAYRKAPEHKFPAAVEDAWAATEWVMGKATSFQGDRGRVAVGGESAGGNLAAVVCLIAREQGAPPLVHQLLIYPVTDLSSARLSYQEHKHARPLSAAMMSWFKKHYLRNEADASNPYASPLLMRDLTGLPPATIINAEYDPLRDDGLAYAEKLRASGVAVTHHNYVGVMHEFFGLTGLIDTAKDAVKLAAGELKKAFKRDAEPTPPDLIDAAALAVVPTKPLLAE